MLKHTPVDCALGHVRLTSKRENAVLFLLLIFHFYEAKRACSSVLHLAGSASGGDYCLVYDHAERLHRYLAFVCGHDSDAEVGVASVAAALSACLFWSVSTGNEKRARSIVSRKSKPMRGVHS